MFLTVDDVWKMTVSPESMVKMDRLRIALIVENDSLLMIVHIVVSKESYPDLLCLYFTAWVLLGSVCHAVMYSLCIKCEVFTCK